MPNYFGYYDKLNHGEAVFGKSLSEIKLKIEKSAGYFPLIQSNKFDEYDLQNDVLPFESVTVYEMMRLFDYV